MNKVVKSIYSEMKGYGKWTEVSDFLACGLVGVKVKTKLNLKDIKTKQRLYQHFLVRAKVIITTNTQMKPLIVIQVILVGLKMKMGITPRREILNFHKITSTI